MIKLALLLGAVAAAVLREEEGRHLWFSIKGWWEMVKVLERC